MAKSVSLPISADVDGIDRFGASLNLMEIEESFVDFEDDERSRDLLNWQLIKSIDLSYLCHFDVFPAMCDEVILCSCEDVREDCEVIRIDAPLNASMPVEPNGMMVIPVCLGLDSVAIMNGSLLSSKALLDSGARCNYISEELVLELKIPVVTKKNFYSVLLADKKTKLLVEYETLPIKLVLGSHVEEITFDVLSTLSYPMIIGLTWLKLHNPVVDWKNHTLVFGRCDCINSEVPVSVDCSESVSLESVLASVIRFGVGFEDEEIFDGDLVKGSEDSELPVCYREFLDVFSAGKADILPEHRKFDCEIELKSPELVPPFRPIYNLSEVDRIELRQYIDEMLAKGFIRPSKSPAGAGVFFVPKKDKTKRLCVDYRGLNELTVRNSFPLPLISDLIDRLRFAKVFTKIDLRGAYNLVRIKPGDEWKTAFRYVFGQFEYTVMPFGLANAPAIFQSMMTQIFRDSLDVYCYGNP